MQVIRMDNREHVTNELPHGPLWSQGLKLAEAEIGRGPAPAGRWARRFGNAAGWSRETAPAEYGALAESPAAQAA